MAIGCIVTGLECSSTFAIDIRSANTSLTIPLVPEAYGYQVENAFPGISFTKPVAVVARPGDSSSLFVVEQAGVIYIIPDLSNPTKSVFLDISSQVDSSSNEEGLFSIAFHPNWETNGYFYLLYTTETTTSGGDGRHDRISRFEINPANPIQSLASSEQPLISQYDQEANHNGGELKFGSDGFLYISLGDEGAGGDAFNNSRFINKDFFSAILRLDVDKLPESLEPNPHPAVHLDSGGLAHYSVPSDNPFIGATSFNGESIDPATVRTEFWAAGLRNPWRFSFDETTGLMYCADVGQNSYEEVNLIKKGGDYGWRLREGFHAYNNNTVPAGVLLEDPILEYPQSGGPLITGGKAEGESITGGVVYRGSRISQLLGYYVFADYVSRRVFVLKYNEQTEEIDDFQQITNVTSPVSFGTDPTNGDILIVSRTGSIYRLLYSDTPIFGSPLPTSLSTTGAFSDLTSLTPEAGIEPYDINVPFWSDHAIKSRWFSVPDLADTIGFDATGNWSFPDGTVWIKHFEMQMVEGDPLSKRRLETRFLVKNTDGIHGFTYKWNAEETDAFLVDEEGEDELLTILDSEGDVVRNQTWRYPSRSECLQCHTSVAGYALGFNTLQLNGDYDYGAGALNQIGALDSVGYFDSSPGDPGLLDELYSESHPTATAEDKARSYLQANCVQCHQPGGPSQGSWDARILIDLLSAGILDGELVNDQGDPDNKVISPGDLTHSMILQRMSTRGSLQMPPLGSNEVDSNGISIMSNWISSLGGGGASPVLSASRSSFTFTEGDSETIIDSGIVIIDTDTTDFSGGSLTVSLVGTDGIDDRLSIENQGSGSGQIGVSGSTVSFEGNSIGIFSGGESFSSPLIISITSSASTAAITALSRAIKFQNISPTPLVFDRTVEFLLTDDTSLTSNTLSYTISISSIPEDPIVNWSNPSDIVYGTALSATQLNATASVAGSFAYSPDFGTVLGAGSNQTLQVTFTPTDTQNYNVVVDSVDINVTKAMATLTATDAQRPYGSSNPAFSFSASGFVNGDSVGDLDTPLAVTTTATPSSPTGAYPVDISSAADANYDFVYVAGTLTVDPAPLTIEANDKSRPYGQSNPPLTATFTGFVLGEGPSDLDTDATLSTSAGPSSAPGGYAISSSGASDPNYSITHVGGILSVGKASATLTAAEAQRPYGSPNPAFSFTASGLLNGDTIDDIDTPPALSSTAVAASSVGDYAINASGASDSNYNFSYAPGTLTVGPVPLSISADNKTRGFGQPNPELTATYTGFVLDEGPEDLDTPPILATTAGPSTAAGIYPITVSGASDPNYTIAFEEGTLTIDKAIVTLTAADTQRHYGSANPTLSYTATGLLNGDTIDDIDSPPVLSTIATSASPTGNYPITLSGASDSDYDFLYVSGNLAVEPVPLIVTAENKSRTYGELNPPLTASYSGFVLGEGPQDLDTPAGLSTIATSASPAGNYAITASGASSPNYAFTYEAGTLTVGKAEAILTAIDAQRAYGSPNPVFSFSIDGLENGDISIADIDTHPSLSSPAVPNSPPGSYALNISGADDPNYTFSYVPATLVITPAPLIITADDKEREFGQPNPELTATYTGFVLGEGPQDLDTPPVLQTTASVESPSDLYEITVAGASDLNYALSFESGYLSIGRTIVTLTANNFQRAYGDPNPEFTYTASGLMNGDTLEDIDTPPTLSTAALQNSDTGTYNIDIAGADDLNYFFTYRKGKLEIDPVNLTASTPNQARPYGSSNPAFTINYEGFVLGDTATDLDTPPTALTSALIDSPVGEYSIELFGGSDTNYTITHSPAALTINPAPLTITANNKARPYGQPNPVLTATYSGFVLGEGPQNLATPATLRTDAVTSSPAGSYAIDVTGASSDNYAITFGQGTLEVQKAAATLTANDAERFYGSENPPFTFAATGLAAGESISDINTLPVLSTIATVSSSPGSYEVVISGASDPNYNFTYAQGTLIVEPAPLSIAADDQSRPYGQPNPALTASYGGFVLDEGPGDLETPAELQTDANENSPVGSYPITVSGATSGNYAISYTEGALEVQKAVATVAASNAQRSYGSDNPPLTFTATGLAAGETIADIETAPTLSTAATASSAPASYPISISGASDPNYAFAHVPGTLTVDPVPLTIKADNKRREFGEPNPALTATYSGFVLGEGPGDLDTQATLSTEADTDSPNGLYGITVSDASDSNYVITLIDGYLSIGRALATFKADDKQKIYGTPNPALTYEAIDLVEPHTVADIDIPPTLSTSAVADSDVGNYVINISGAEDSEYFFVYQPAELEILPGTLTVTAEDKIKTYGQPNPPLTANYTGFVNDDGESDLDTPPQLNTEVLESSPTGDYVISISGASDLNYDFEYQPGTLTVEPAPLTITAEDKQRAYGQANPLFTASYIGLVLGDTPDSIDAQINLSTSARTDSLPGSYPINISGSIGSNYTVAFVGGILVVNASVGPLKLVYDHAENTSSIQFPGVPMSGYTIETSLDLNVWQPITNVTTDQNGLGTYTFEIDRSQFKTLFLRVLPQDSE